MGAGTSAQQLPTRTKAKEMTVEEVCVFIEAAGYPKACEAIKEQALDGKALLGLSAPQLAELGIPLSAAGPVLKQFKQKRRLSISAGEELGARRNSLVTFDVEDKVKMAPDDFAKVALLLEAIKDQAAKKADADVAFLAWGMSCVNMLSTGDADNRKELHDKGACESIMSLMEQYADDVHIQWQGCQCIARLSATKEAADAFGFKTLESVLNCMSDVDDETFGQFSLTGSMAMKQLLKNSEAVLEEAKKSEGFILKLQELMDLRGKEHGQFGYEAHTMKELMKPKAS